MGILNKKETLTPTIQMIIDPLALLVMGVVVLFANL